MTTPAEEPKKISEEAPEAQEDGTVWIKWDVKKGSDRTMPKVYIATSYPLEGSPNIQGVEIRGDRVTLSGWADTEPNGEPNLSVDGPTGGKVKVDPRRVGSFRVDRRE